MKKLATVFGCALIFVSVFMTIGCKKNNIQTDEDPSGDYYVKFKLDGDEVLFDHGVLGWQDEFVDNGNVVYRFYFNIYPQQGDSGEILSLTLYSSDPLQPNKTYKSAGDHRRVSLSFEGPQFAEYIYVISGPDEAVVEFTEITDKHLKGKFSGRLSLGIYELPGGNVDSETITEVKITAGEFYVPLKDLGN